MLVPKGKAFGIVAGPRKVSSPRGTLNATVELRLRNGRNTKRNKSIILAEMNRPAS